MATSAFKSTTRRTTVGASNSEESSSRSLRRSRSLSRFSRTLASETGAEADHNKNVPRGKFVNTKRGSTTPFPEISLDDLALEFFSSSSRTENESDGGVVKRKGREGRSASRRDGEIGRWTSDTASSLRRGRSVSVSRWDAANASCSTTAAKKVISSDASSRRRRSLSVARYQISDSESEVDHSRNFNPRANAEAVANGDRQTHLALSAEASANRRTGRSRSRNDLSVPRDGYSSHSTLTDDELRDNLFEKTGFGKINSAVYAQQKVNNTAEGVATSGLYETRQKQLTCAAKDILSEFNQAMGKDQTALGSDDYLLVQSSEGLQNLPRIREKYATKLEKLEKCKQDLLAEMLLEEQRGRGLAKVAPEKAGLRISSVAHKPLRGRKRSCDRSRVSATLIEEAERYFEDFICNVEDTDISSFDGERSDGSSSLGGIVKARDTPTGEVGTSKSLGGIVEMDGVLFPWLEWETTGYDSSLSGRKMEQTPMSPTTPQWHSDKNDQVQKSLLHELGSLSVSSHGSWNPSSCSQMDKGQDTCNTRNIDMDEYLHRCNDEEVLIEMYRERNRIHSGGLLLCHRSTLY